MTDIARVVAVSLVPSLVEGECNLNWGGTPLWSHVDVCMSIYVDLTAIHTRCFELSVAVPHKPCFVSGLAVRGFDALQEFGEARTWIAAVVANDAEQWTTIDELKSHDREGLDENWRLKHQLRIVGVGKEIQEPQDVKHRMSTFCNVKVEFLKVTEAFCVVEDGLSADWSVMYKRH